MLAEKVVLDKHQRTINDYFNGRRSSAGYPVAVLDVDEPPENLLEQENAV